MFKILCQISTIACIQKLKLVNIVTFLFQWGQSIFYYNCRYLCFLTYRFLDCSVITVSIDCLVNMPLCQLQKALTWIALCWCCFANCTFVDFWLTEYNILSCAHILQNMPCWWLNRCMPPFWGLCRYNTHYFMEYFSVYDHIAISVNLNVLENVLALYGTSLRHILFLLLNLI